ncbi:MAG: hypothetical protein SH817_11875 [Leptospira sp.]|nr:hypothetical protein [Leptospira sp.]
MKFIPSLRTLLWIDAAGALLSALVNFLFRNVFTNWFNLPLDLFLLLSMIGLVFSLYSITLALLNVTKKYFLYGLVSANASYGLLCICLFIYYFKQATVFGNIFFMVDASIILTLSLWESKIIKIYYK